MYRFFLVFCAFLHFSQLNAQGVVVTPAGAPARTELLSRNALRTWGITDTLSLPFFDDFTSTEVLPDARRWSGNQVYVNRTFVSNAPSFGVATFDHLNPNGAPWSPLNFGTSRGCDTLNSQAINLKFYRNGAANVPYKASDSIYLSFFYLCGGLGDRPELDDSLVLQFLQADGNWVTQWKRTGFKQEAFIQALVPVLEAANFHEGFQFRFINFSRPGGNLNHWHLDYIRMARGRNFRDTGIRDVAISSLPGGLLGTYHSMPYRQFLANTAANADTIHELNIRNNNTVAVQTQYQFTARSNTGLQLAQSPFLANNRNVLALSDTTERFKSFPLTGLSGTEPWVDVEYRINPLSNDQTPGEYNAIGDNNRVTRRQRFTPWLAYDDGSAEGGFGLDYSFLGNVRGQVAMRFKLDRADTLHGISTFFNRSREDVGSRPFTLMIWKRIAEPPALSNVGDQIWYSTFVERPRYTDSMQEFTYYMFDTALALPAGDFYIGWRQQAPFILNIGYDNNFRFAGKNVANPYVFFDLYGKWERMPVDVAGAPMMRPLLGSKSQYTFGASERPDAATQVFPNPVSGNELHIKSAIHFQQFRLFDMQGRCTAAGRVAHASLMLPEQLRPGMYILQLQGDDGRLVNHRIQKQ